MVYNAENFFVGSSNPMAWVVKRYKLKSKKSFFWDTLVTSLEFPAPVTFYNSWRASLKSSPSTSSTCRPRRQNNKEKFKSRFKFACFIGFQLVVKLEKLHYVFLISSKLLFLLSSCQHRHLTSVPSDPAHSSSCPSPPPSLHT